MMLGALTKNQQTQLLTQENQTNADFPLDQCTHQLFEKQVERTPDAVAVVFEESQLTYRELNSRANQLAHHLISLGVKPETLVGICVERSLEMIIGLLGILKAGGAYVPLDPAYPKERLAFMLKDAQVSVLVTQQHLQGILPKHDSTVVDIDSDWETIAKKSDENPSNRTIPDNLAYCIYTSGSTGIPKGVLLEHRGLCNLAIAQKLVFNIQPNSRVLQFASLNFDASIWEIVMALMSGATLCLARQEALLPSSLQQLLHEQAITTVTLPPSILASLSPETLTKLQTVITAGESCSAELVARWATARHFFNAYGPTETTVCGTIAQCKDKNVKPPIGRPIANAQVYILDNRMQQVPLGSEGELHIGGIGLARGYLNRPELTSEKFVPNPFSDASNSRLYKTGDLVRYLPDGNLEFLGRIDHQVKIRGFRIELGEIEAKLHQYPDLSDAVVIAREDVPGDKRLVAYIIPSQLPRQRVPLHSEGKIKCLIADNNMRPPKEVNTFDISYGGVGLLGMPIADCRQGKRLSVHLRLPDMSDELCVEGNIAWQQGDRAGIQFDPTPDKTIQLHNHLNEFLEKKGVLKILQNTFIEHLRHFLQESLPDYMVPSHFVMLDALPLTPNGKVDRNALPAPNINRSDLYSDIEEKLVKIWAEILGLERVGLHDNFLQLGGHSLLATQIVSHLNEEFSVDLPLYCLFEAPTVAKLAVQVEEVLKSSCPLTQAIEQADRNTDLPLSFGQQQLWLFGQLVPNSPVYNEPATIRLGGPIDGMVLEQSLNEIFRRHEILRTTFTTINGEPVQVISPFVPFTLPVRDLREFPDSERETECWRLATEEAVQPFDLENGPLFRATLMRLSEEDYRLCLTAHHIISDGVSLYNVLFPELATLYQAFSARQPSPLPTPTFQYADYASWQRQQLQGEVLEKQLTYWKKQLADLPTLQLPTDHPRPAVQTYRGARYCLSLPKVLTESLKEFSQQEGVTLFMTLLAAFKILLYRYSGQDDIPVGTVTGGRNHTELENIFGFFLNTLVLRTDLSDNPNAKQVLQKVREVTLNAYAHEDLPFELLVKELLPERQSSANPLFQVAFILEPQVPEIDQGWTLSQLDIHPGTAKFDLTMELDERAEGIIGRIEYNTDLFYETTIIRMAGHYQSLLEGMVADPEQSISQLPLLTTNEQQQFLDWNKSPLELCVHELFEDQVDRSPDAVAVVFEDQTLTYRELNNRANQLANYLKTLGIGPETVVGVYMERSLEMVVGIYGIIKAGGAYMPLDPSYPQGRLTFMLEDAQPKVILTQQHLRTGLPKQKASVVVCLNSEWEDDIAQENAGNLINEATPDSLAYVIYTSGSTGQPKGVMNIHRAICNRLLWMQDAYKLTAFDKVLQKTPFSFDVSIWEFFWPLLTGASLVVAKPDGHRDSAYLAELIAKQKITTLHFVPSMLQVFLNKPHLEEDCRSLRQVLCSGEALPVELQKKFFACFEHTELHNLYGPTEAAIDVTYWQCQRESHLQTVPIGRPITNIQLYILDKNLRQLPVGIAGELHIGGIGLARGYLNRPELTEEKFISNPFDDTPNARLYKTGDLVRYLSDGNLEFLGRIDHQVKIRGFRIELGEIEAVLTQHPQIREIVVMAREDIPGDKRLVAYFVAKQSLPSITELRQFLADKLPDYMIPSAFVALETLPLTPNGKVDRKALPKPQDIQREVTASLVAPQTELEQTIAKIWQEVLHVEKVGIQDTFFELGGHSLLVVQMQEKLVKALNKKIPVTVLFQYPTIQGLAQYLSQSLNRQPTMATPKVRSARAAKKQAAIAQRKQYHKTRQTKLAA